MPERSLTLDALRGIAILGTMASNLWIFAYWTWAYLPKADGEMPFDHSLDAWLFRLSEVFIGGKFLAMLAILFGVGIAIQRADAGERRSPWPRSYWPRCGWLLAVGVLHYLLVFSWDILMGYAVAAALVAPLIDARPATRRIVIRVLILLHLAWVAWAVLTFLLTSPQSYFALLKRWEALDVLAHSTYLWSIEARIVHAGHFRGEVIFGIPYFMLLMLTGVWLHRAGLLTPAADPGLRRTLIIWGLGLGLPLTLLSILPAGHQTSAAIYMISRYLAAPLMGVAYLVIGAALIQRSRSAPWLGLAAVGRAALSSYVLGNLVCAAVFFYWGLNFRDQFMPWQLALGWVALSLANILIASLWLRRFKAGPLESVWQRLRPRAA